MTGTWTMKKIRYTRSRFRWKIEVAMFFASLFDFS
jgi:hypothetical protein